jgi:dTDP-4-amino-4,6-dideoxygalactose transaminase
MSRMSSPKPSVAVETQSNFSPAPVADSSPPAPIGTNSPVPVAPGPVAPAAVAPVPLLDMNRQYAAIRAEIRAAIDAVCESGRFVLGPDCEALEREVAAYCRAKYAVGCASGSDALLLALMALGVGPGDDVIVPSYTFFATASAVWRVGARIVFADIDPETYNIDAAHVEALVTPATKAVIPVHLFGRCDDIVAVDNIARSHNVAVIEDAAQAIGAEADGRRAGSIGDVGCLSFYPTKNLGGMGDGGMMTANREDVAERLRLLAAHGMNPRYYHKVVGVNSRLDSIQAAVLRVKLKYLDQWTDRRAANARRYAELFAEHKLDRVLELPAPPPRGRHVWNQYVVRVPDGRRDALRQSLTDARIGTEIYYPVPLHLQACFRSLGYGEGSLPEAELAAKETLALPIYPELTADEQRTVVGRIAEFFNRDPSRKVHGLDGPKYLKKRAARAPANKGDGREPTAE